MALSFLSSPGPLSDSDLHEAERVALASDSLPGQLAARLLVEVRRLQHQLADPSFMYAGGRIHRHAIVCRQTEIDALRQDAARLKWLEDQMRPAEGYVEVYLAGLRNGTPDWTASAYQVELQDQPAVNGTTLRDAIDAARKVKK